MTTVMLFLIAACIILSFGQQWKMPWKLERQLIVLLGAVALVAAFLSLFRVH